MVVRAAVARRLFNEATKDQVFDDEILVLEAIYPSSTSTSWHQTSTPVWPPLTAAPGIFARAKRCWPLANTRSHRNPRSIERVRIITKSRIGPYLLKPFGSKAGGRDPH
jgi:hypothetical protein